jgi:hypothetical protein
MVFHVVLATFFLGKQYVQVHEEEGLISITYEIFGKNLRNVDTSLLVNFEGARFETTPSCCATVNRILLNFNGNRVVACTATNNLNGMDSLECQRAVDQLNALTSRVVTNQAPPAYLEKP